MRVKPPNQRSRLGTAGLIAFVVEAVTTVALILVYGWRGALVGAALIGGAWLFSYSRTAAARHEARLADAPEVRALKADFSRWRLTPTLEPQAVRALDQLEAARQEHARFTALLGEKLSPSELTYARWSSAADDFGRAFWHGFEDLREAMSRTDLPEVERRLKVNDEGLAKLREARGALAAISSAPSETDYAAALKELESVVARAKRLAASQRSPDAAE